MKELTSSDFPEKTTASKLNLDGISKESLLHQLITMLNCTTLTGQDELEDSIMEYDNLCTHDDGFLCEHRLQFIVDFIKVNYDEK